MSDDMLFDVAECKSPRLKWMEKHGIRTYNNSEMSNQWMAIYSHGPDSQNARGDSEDDALVALALKMKIKTWKEEAL